MFHRIVRLRELYDGLRVPFSVGKQELLFLHEHGESWLVSRRCPHADFPLDNATLEGGALRCPQHGLCFSLQTGACASANYKIQRYRLAYQDDWIGVDVA